MFQRIQFRIRQCLKQRKGQGLTEYAVILSIVVAVALAINQFHYGEPTPDSQGQPGQHFGFGGEVRSIYNRISERITALAYELRGDHVNASGSHAQHGGGK